MLLLGIDKYLSDLEVGQNIRVRMMSRPQNWDEGMYCGRWEWQPTTADFKSDEGGKFILVVDSTTGATVYCQIACVSSIVTM